MSLWLLFLFGKASSRSEANPQFSSSKSLIFDLYLTHFTLVLESLPEQLCQKRDVSSV